MEWHELPKYNGIQVSQLKIESILKHFRNAPLTKLFVPSYIIIIFTWWWYNWQVLSVGLHSIQKSKRWGSWLSRYCKFSKATQILKVTELPYLKLWAKKKSFKPISVFESNREDMIKSGSVLPLVMLISCTWRLYF